MTPTQERRSGQAGQLPTAMVQAVRGLEKWKLNIMFVIGLAGMAGLVYWFTFGDRGHDHSTPEFIFAGLMFMGCAFFAFPLGTTRLADKYVPDKWRRDQRAQP